MFRAWQRYLQNKSDPQDLVEDIITSNFENVLENSSAVHKIYQFQSRGITSNSVLAIDEYSTNSFLLSGSNDGTASLYEVQGQQSKGLTKVVTAAKHHDYQISALDWYPGDNGLFVTGSNDMTVKLWDTNKFTPVWTWAFEGKIRQLHCHVNNDLVLVTHDKGLRLIDMKTMNSILTLPIAEEPYSGKFNQHLSFENFLATGDARGHLQIWDLRNLAKPLYIKEEFAHKGRPCIDLVWNDHGTSVATLGLDNNCVIWNPWEQQHQRPQKLRQAPMTMPNVSLSLRDSLGKPQLFQKDRTYQRLAWLHNKYLFVNNDLCEVQVFDTSLYEMKALSRFQAAYPTGPTSYIQFTGMAIRSPFKKGDHNAITGTAKVYLGGSLDSRGVILEYL